MGMGWGYFGGNILPLHDGNYLISNEYEFGIADYYYENYGMLTKINPEGNLIWAVKDSVSFTNCTENVFTVEDDNGYIVSYSTGQISSISFLQTKILPIGKFFVNYHKRCL